MATWWLPRGEGGDGWEGRGGTPGRWLNINGNCHNGSYIDHSNNHNGKNGDGNNNNGIKLSDSYIGNDISNNGNSSYGSII